MAGRANHVLKTGVCTEGPIPVARCEALLSGHQTPGPIKSSPAHNCIKFAARVVPTCRMSDFMVPRTILTPSESVQGWRMAGGPIRRAQGAGRICIFEILKQMYCIVLDCIVYAILVLQRGYSTSCNTSSIYCSKLDKALPVLVLSEATRNDAIAAVAIQLALANASCVPYEHLGEISWVILCDGSLLIMSGYNDERFYRASNKNGCNERM